MATATTVKDLRAELANAILGLTPTIKSHFAWSYAEEHEVEGADPRSFRIDELEGGGRREGDLIVFGRGCVEYEVFFVVQVSYAGMDDYATDAIHEDQSALQEIVDRQQINVIPHEGRVDFVLVEDEPGHVKAQFVVPVSYLRAQ